MIFGLPKVDITSCGGDKLDSDGRISPILFGVAARGYDFRGV